MKGIPFFELLHAAKNIFQRPCSPRQGHAAFPELGMDFVEGDTLRNGALELKEETAPREIGPLDDVVIELDPRIEPRRLLG